MSVHSFMVQWFSSVQFSSSRVQAELLETERVSAAQECVRQFVFLIFVCSTDGQDLSTSGGVFGDRHLVPWLRELRPMVVGVNDADRSAPDGVTKDNGKYKIKTN